MPHKIPRGLYALIDDSVRRDRPLLELAFDAMAGGVRVLQLRLEQTTDRVALPLIREVVAAAKPSQVVILVNDRIDLALAAAAHGVHLGADDLPVDVARKLLGPAAIIGATTRGLDDIERARAAGADYVGLGPLFPTHTKAVAHPPLGLKVFAKIVSRAPLPVVGIAGITLATIGQVAAAGAWGAAVAGDLLKADDVVSRARALEQAFSQAR